MSTPTVSDITALFDDVYPPHFAQEWDAVGLVVGDPSRPVQRVLFAVDPVTAVIDEAIEYQADLLVVHHPLFLRGVTSVAATTFKGLVVQRLIEAGCALYTAHTNADASSGGASQWTATMLSLSNVQPLIPDPEQPDAGLGRVGTLPIEMTLKDFADKVADIFPSTEHGIRIAGQLDAPVRTVAICSGSGDSLFDEVRKSGADVYLTSDLRHHPASEAREAAAGGPPYLVDVAHFASEWPWALEADSVLKNAAESSGWDIETHVSTTNTDPWTARLEY